MTTAPSQKRSGLASAALLRQKRQYYSLHNPASKRNVAKRAAAKKVASKVAAAKKPIAKPAAPKPVVKPATPATPAPVATQPTVLPNTTGQPVATTVADPGTPGTPATATAPGTPGTPGTTTTVPVVKINENGQLDLPYGEAFGSSLLEHQESMNKELLDLQEQQQLQAQEYATQKRDANQGYAESKREVLNKNAASGTAFSSAYGKQFGDTATNYNNYMTDLESRNTEANAGVSKSRTAIETAFNDYLRKAVLDRGVELEADAGKLGYGKTPIPVRTMPKAPQTYAQKKAAAAKRAAASKRAAAKKRAASKPKRPKGWIKPTKAHPHPNSKQAIAARKKAAAAKKKKK